MIKIKDKADCCGCTACASICAHNAITMQPDVLGFLYPIVDESKCTNCGLCEKVCAFNNLYDKSLNFDKPLAFAARHKNLSEVETSRSGAAFIAISDYIIEHGGVIYGAGYKDHFRVAHKRATTKKERDEFKGSKYVQSDLTGVFNQVKNDLRNGLTVLFSGTPCQTSGLNSYVGKKLRLNLILIDIVCHGVPGPYLWRDYIAYLEKKQGDKICWVNFRDKQKYGWSAHHETFKFENDKERKISFPYTFYQPITFRQSCGKCHFSNTKRPSDITIADFWGWERISQDINKDDKGVSLIFINTANGQLIFEKIRHNMNVIPAKLMDCMQPNLLHPSKIHPKRMIFEEEYKQRGFEYVINKYRDSLIKKILRKLKRKIKNFAVMIYFIKK